MVRLDWDQRQVAIARLALSQLSQATDTGAERAEIAEMLADLNPEATMAETPMDHYQLRIPAGTMVDGAVARLTLDERGILTAEVRIPAHQEGQP